MLLYRICTLLLLLSAGCKGIQDSIAHHNSQARRGIWWDYANSWKWKYRCRIVSAGTDWETIMPDTNTPRFFGSTTFLVWSTDAWHFFGMLNMSCWQVAICLLLPFPWYGQLAVFAAIKAAYGGVFELVYRHVNKKAA
jgi:hypothetical protein